MAKAAATAKKAPAAAKSAPAKATPAPKATKATPANEAKVKASKAAKPVVEEVVETVQETATAVQTLFDELFEAAKSIRGADFALPHAAEKEQVFYKRLAAAISDLTDESYDKLSEDARNWADASIEAVNNATALPKIEGYEDIAAKQPAPTGVATTKAAGRNTDGLKAYRERVAAAKANGEVLPKVAKAPKAPKEDKGPGRVETIRRFVIDNPECTNEQIAAHLVNVGIAATEPGTISVTAGGTRAAIAYIRETGHWKN
jgi:hypothetical protein